MSLQTQPNLLTHKIASVLLTRRLGTRPTLNVQRTLSVDVRSPTQHARMRVQTVSNAFVVMMNCAAVC